MELFQGPVSRQSEYSREASSRRAFIFAVQIAALTIYPVLIAPLFNKFDPLPPGTLRCGPSLASRRADRMLTPLHLHALLLNVPCYLADHCEQVAWCLSQASHLLFDCREWCPEKRGRAVVEGAPHAPCTGRESRSWPRR